MQTLEVLFGHLHKRFFEQVSTLGARTQLKESIADAPMKFDCYLHFVRFKKESHLLFNGLRTHIKPPSFQRITHAKVPVPGLAQQIIPESTFSTDRASSSQAA